MEFDFSQQPGLARWSWDRTRTGPPLVSIVTPYYNGGRHIRQTCRSVLDQTFPWFEWILVDDGSTREEDWQILLEVARKDPRIRVFRKKNGGIASARNCGIRNARSGLVLPLDCDDLLEPTFLEYCWWMLEKNPGAAWAYCDSLGFQGQEYLWRHPFDPERLKTENHLTATALIRREAIMAIGCYNQRHKHYNEDWYAWLKLVARGGYPAQSCGEPLFWYRRSDSGVLSLVEQDPEIRQANQALIASAAAEVKDPHPPVLYPKPFTYNWETPVCSQWDLTVSQSKTKIRVAFLFPHLEMGGADKFNLDLLSGLDKKRYEVGILTTNTSSHAWLQAFRRVTPEIFNLANFLDPRDYAEFITYYLRSRQVDVLFVSNSFHGYYLLPWLRQQFPKLAIVDYVHMEEWYWRRGGYARTSAMAAAVTERTYVCNSATARVLEEQFHRDPSTLETVPIGVDEAYFDRERVSPGGLYRIAGIPENRPVVLFICRLHPQKRPFLMLEIAQKMAKLLPEVAFAVVGSGPQEEELRQRSAAMELDDTVFFLGAYQDVRPFYRDAKVTLVCSLKEGLSLTAYESCAMGVPVVTADVGGQSDLIDSSVGALVPCLQDDAVDLDARTFPQEEIDGYIDALLPFLQDEALWKAASAACRQRIEDRFSVQRMVHFFDWELERLVREAGLTEKRAAIAKALEACGPLAGELYTLEMQHQNAENGCCPPYYDNMLVDFAKRALGWARRQAHRVSGK